MHSKQSNLVTKANANKDIEATQRQRLVPSTAAWADYDDNLKASWPAASATAFARTPEFNGGYAARGLGTRYNKLKISLMSVEFQLSFTHITAAGIG